MESGLYLVSTPIGNLDDMTVRAVEALRSADVVYAEDTRRTRRLLSALELRVPLRSLHAHNEEARRSEILDRLRAGERVALVSDAGTPVVSDPGGRTVASALAEGLRVIPVPGPSAVLAALAASGLPGDEFAFLGFPPRGGGGRARWIERAARFPGTVVCFESPKRLGRLLEDLREAGLGDRACAVARELTKLHEEVRRGTVAGLAAAYAETEPRGEVTVVLEGAGTAEPREAGAEEARAVREEARRLAAAGHSTREIAARLREAFGVSRNDAYEAGLRASALSEEGGP